MKNFDSRAYSISDFLEWSERGQLELNPKFQRKSVWTDNARSYLMDTIIRGKPIPKVFIRQTMNLQTRQSTKEVVDGQQRLRTILSYLHDGFVISKKHNPTYGGLYFSQLIQVDPDIQGTLLNYEISTDLLVDMPDSEILDIFGRLNSYSVVLNEQERINANHFGPFKTLSDSIARIFNDFWIKNKILTDKEILRMADVTITADLLIAMIEGIRSKKQIKTYYDMYEKIFLYDPEILEENFISTIDAIQRIFNGNLKETEFKRIHLFYSLFTTIYHLKFGIPGITKNKFNITNLDYARIENHLDKINLIFATEDLKSLNTNEIGFLQDTRIATTDKSTRERRTNYLIDLILE